MDDTEQNTPENGAVAAPGRTPPYIAFQTLLTLFTELKTNGLPPQIDRSVLKRFAGGMQSQIMLSLRSLNLVSGKENAPTPALALLVQNYETNPDQFKALMTNLIVETYPYVLALDLMSATPTMFADAFKKNTGAKEDVLRKCRTFFLNAAKFVDIPIGQRLLVGGTSRAPRAASGSVTKRKPKAARARTGDDGAATVLHQNNKPDASLVKELLGKFPAFDPAWPDPIKAKWFEGFDTFMSSIKDKGG